MNTATLAGGEQQIGSAAQIRFRTSTDPIAESLSMDEPAHG